MGNMAFVDNIEELREKGLRALRDKVPAEWRITAEPGPTSDSRLDFLARISTPSGDNGLFAVELKQRLDPKGVVYLAETTRPSLGGMPLLVLAPYLSKATREQLTKRSIGYLDLTGNAHVALSKPALFVETHGANEDPEGDERTKRSLKGPKASRVVRTLIDLEKPPGVREIATQTSLDAGYVSRVLAFLDTESLIARGKRGRIESVDWPGLLRRWADDAPLDSRGKAETFLEPRGLQALLDRLPSYEGRYAITGETAAARIAPVAPARLATIWAEDVRGMAQALGLRKTDSGANVMLIQPRDESVFTRAESIGRPRPLPPGQFAQSDEGILSAALPDDRLWYAAPSQVAADLLTGLGRAPNEGEALIEWMRNNEKVWRT
jgi:hypothetical protein